MKNEIVPIHGGFLETRVSFDVKRVVRLTMDVVKIVRIAHTVHDVKFALEGRAAYCEERTPLPPLPANVQSTLAAVDEFLQPATRETILDSLTVLTGLYPSYRGDAETLATAGADLIEVEELSTIAVLSATITLLRPIPGKRARPDLGQDEEPPQARKFMPSLSELILEARSQEETWWERRNWLARLEEDHGLAEMHLRLRHRKEPQLPKPPVRWMTRSAKTTRYLFRGHARAREIGGG